jgi:pyruvate dehydrogenase E1 component
MSAQLQPAANDPDSFETQEWLDALESVLAREGPERAHFLLEALIDKARRSGAHIPYSANTAYINTIPPHLEEPLPGDPALEERIRSYIRWNAMAMVVRANRGEGDLGGHIASYASVNTLMEMGFNHFWRAPNAEFGGDLLYIQGHSAPGVYARAFLEGRLTEEQLNNFRRDVDGKGITSYPHPKLMPEFWQFPTVSMGLGPIQGIYQARFLRYLHARGLADTTGRKVWVFCGDGEMDEPESLGAIGLAAREHLDNLVFVVNCNLQRLDGPVRGNGKIIQELEGVFRGAGWNVIKVIWGSYWDPLLAHDHEGRLLRVMEETIDGEYQNYKANDGAFVRKHFFGKDPKLLEMVSRMTDADIWRLNRGGHDPHKIHAAYAAAMRQSEQPTVILAKTVKGYGMGKVGEGKNPTHQLKKLDTGAIREFRDRFAIPIADDKLDELPYYKPAENSPEMQYMHERRRALNGYLPQRRRRADEKIAAPALDVFQAVLDPTSEGREISTTQAFVRSLNQLVRDKNIGPRVVPIIPDEARTFGMEGMFRQLGIYSSKGQLYEPVDRDQVMYYREDKAGQILEEGINEAGAMCSWIAASTSYSTNNRIMVPFYILYSMFGFQRIGDLAWAAGDMQSRGFLLGATAGRTTLNGEGLQHQDGHSHLLSATIPNCVSYDPTFAHEVAVILQSGHETHDRGPGKCVVLHHADERELSAAGPEERPGRRHPERHVSAARRAGRQRDGQVNCARAAARQRHDPARVARCGRDAGKRLGRGWRRLERHQLHTVAARGHRRRALEPASSGRQAAQALRDAAARENCGTDRCQHRLHATLRRPDPRLCPERTQLPGARHRRLRSFRHPREAARVLRSRPALHYDLRAQGAGRRRRVAKGQGE